MTLGRRRLRYNNALSGKGNTLLVYTKWRKILTGDKAVCGGRLHNQTHYNTKDVRRVLLKIGSQEGGGRRRRRTRLWSVDVERKRRHYRGLLMGNAKGRGFIFDSLAPSSASRGCI